MHLIILGAPGSGKGTQAKLLAEKFKLTHISTGQLLRSESQKDTEKGKLIAKLLSEGSLLPFETVLELLEPVVQSSPQFILDGTPRDLHQAEYLEYFFQKLNISLDKVLYLNIPKDESLKRLLKRAETEHRSDDNSQTILHRLDVYEKETLPVIEYYQKQNKLIEIDGTPDIQTIFLDLTNHLSLA